MDTKKGLDLAAGRLARIPGPRGGPRSAPRKRTSSYNTERLGLTAEADPLPAGRSQPPSSRGDTRADPAPASPDVAGSRHRLVDVEALWKYARRPWAWAAALGIVAAVTLACLFRGGANEGTTPPRAIAQVPGSKPAGAVTTDETAPGEVPVAVDSDRTVDEPPAPVEPASKPALPKGARDSVTARVSSFLRWVRATGVRAGRQGSALARIDAQRPAGAMRSGGDPVRPAATGSGSEGTATSPRGDGSSTDPNEDGSSARTKAPGAPASPLYTPCPPGFTFTGAIRQPTGVFANINGRFVRVGDTVSGARVVKIGRSSVEMELDGVRFVVCFGSAPQRRADTDETGPDGQAPAEPVSTEKDPNSRGARTE